ncbi:hypothetical protein HDV05_005059 [Chytridiales sp. JEL 0842]|nr:hypothetical protein HDV05_005059 [Chytridiales sp. JEL 0842]
MSNNIEALLSEIAQQLHQVNGRLSTFERAQTESLTTINTMKMDIGREFQQINERVSALEQGQADSLTAINNQVQTIQQINERVSAFEQAQADSLTAINDTKTDINKGGQQMQQINERLSNLEQTQDSLLSAINESKCEVEKARSDLEVSMGKALDAHKEFQIDAVSAVGDLKEYVRQSLDGIVKKLNMNGYASTLDGLSDGYGSGVDEDVEIRVESPCIDYSTSTCIDML